MEFVKLTSSNSKEFDNAWDLYESAFPLDERRTLEQQRQLISDEKYNFSIVLKDKVFVAIIADWDFEDFLFVEHLAVKEEFRGKGIGTELLDEYLSKNKRKIVLEVERPDGGIADKRIIFYEKMGFVLNNFDYIQPPYGKGKSPVPLFLMTFPKKMNEGEFSLVREKLHKVVYGLDEPLVELN